MSDPISWDNVTETNVDKIEEEVQKLETTVSAPLKKKRGRPAKPKTPEIPSTPVGPPPPPVSYEESIPSEQLASMFYKSPPSTPRSKSPVAVKFQEEDLSEEADLSERLDHEILLKIYESFFREPLASRHNRRKKSHDEHTPKKVLERDVKELQRIVGSSDPAVDLCHGWAKVMGVLEMVGLNYNLPLWGLGEEASKKSSDPEFTDTFRELLIKYPRLRSYMVMGGFPELRLAVASVMLANDVADRNIATINSSKIPKPERPQQNGA